MCRAELGDRRPGTRPTLHMHWRCLREFLVRHEAAVLSAARAARDQEWAAMLEEDLAEVRVAWEALVAWLEASARFARLGLDAEAVPPGADIFARSVEAEHPPGSRHLGGRPPDPRPAVRRVCRPQRRRSRHAGGGLSVGVMAA